VQVHEHLHYRGSPLVAPPDQTAAIRAAEVHRVELWWIAAAAVLAGAAALRLMALTAKALWFDETFSVFVAGHPVARLIAIVAANDAHPPLYYLLLRAWILVFGDGEAAVRAPSVVIGTAIVAVTWLFGRRLVGQRPALLAAALVAVAPSQVSSSQEARMGALLVLTALGSWWALWETAHGSRRAWWVYVTVSAVMLYSHYYAFFMLASQAVYVAWTRRAGADLRRAILAGLAILLLFAPWVPALAGHLAGGQAWPAHRFPITPAMFADTFALMTAGLPVVGAADPRGWSLPRFGSAQIALLGFVAAFILVAAGMRGVNSVWRSAASSPLLPCAAVCPVVFAYAASLVRNVYSPRYLIFITVPIALLTAAGLAALWRGRARWSRAVGLVLAALIFVPNVMVLGAFYRQPALDVFDWRSISRTMATAARPDDAIVFLPGFSRIPVNYYFRGPQPRLALTPQRLEGAGGQQEMRAVVAALARHPRVWVLTVVPVPPSVVALVDAMRRESYTLTAQQAINMARLVLLERAASP